MKLLHTSDWHLGRTLFSQKRYPEFKAFLDWLINTITTQQIEVLLIAGDVFDTTTPSHHAQKLYYQFLSKIAHSQCRHVVIIAGNHDSPSFINAPKTLLSAINVHVVGHTDAPQDEVLVLNNRQNQPELIVCAVPYLRDRDIRHVEANESIQDKEKKLIHGIRDHYKTVSDIAKQLELRLSVDLPIVGMGHLFTAGGQTVEGDGVRDLYVGSLAHIDSALFPDIFDYIALGHLHVPQKVGGKDHIRYSGSPIPMGFGEAKQKKSVFIVEFFPEKKCKIDTLEIPRFQELKRVQGGWISIKQQLESLIEQRNSVWVEIIYEGDEIIGNLRDRIFDLVNDTQILILRIQNKRLPQNVMAQSHEERLDELDVNEVFKQCLETHEVPEEQRIQLMAAYQEVVFSLLNNDNHED